MDELKLRLEYLESATEGTAADDGLLEKVDAIGSTLDTMLGVRKNEAERMAAEFNKLDLFSQRHPEGPGNPPSEEVKKAVIESRFDELSRLATELETQLPLEVPEVKSPPSPQELLSKASELGREFDELTIRSAELTKKLMEQLEKENSTFGKLDNKNNS